jgi:(p)ppGpp synthase/HD superfamily hydrolase
LIDSLLYPELTFIVIFLHDTVEDKEEVTIEVVNEMFGPVVAEKVNKISKVRAGVKIPNDIYYPDMAEDPVVSVVKALDRDHNISTMLNGMTIEKQKAYIKETKDYVIVMLKRAKRAFPEQEAFYENLKYSLFKQVQLYEAIHETQVV